MVVVDLWVEDAYVILLREKVWTKEQEGLFFHTFVVHKVGGNILNCSKDLTKFCLL